MKHFNPNFSGMWTSQVGLRGGGGGKGGAEPPPPSFLGEKPKNKNFPWAKDFTKTTQMRGVKQF